MRRAAVAFDVVRCGTVVGDAVVRMLAVPFDIPVAVRINVVPADSAEVALLTVVSERHHCQDLGRVGSVLLQDTRESLGQE